VACYLRVLAVHQGYNWLDGLLDYPWWGGSGAGTPTFTRVASKYNTCKIVQVEDKVVQRENCAPYHEPTPRGGCTHLLLAC
jgi:hypothetical protein